MNENKNCILNNKKMIISKLSKLEADLYLYKWRREYPTLNLSIFYDEYQEYEVNYTEEEREQITRLV